MARALLGYFWPIIAQTNKVHSLAWAATPSETLFDKLDVHNNTEAAVNFTGPRPHARLATQSG